MIKISVVYVLDIKKQVFLKTIVVLDKCEKDKGYHEFSIAKMGVKQSSVINKQLASL